MLKGFGFGRRRRVGTCGGYAYVVVCLVARQVFLVHEGGEKGSECVVSKCIPHGCSSFVSPLRRF